MDDEEITGLPDSDYASRVRGIRADCYPPDVLEYIIYGGLPMPSQEVIDAIRDQFSAKDSPPMPLDDAESKDKSRESGSVVDALLSADVRLCEGIAGVWRYHLCPADDETGTKSLCGKPTMRCDSPVNTWGYKPAHMPSSYCEECERIALSR